MILYGGKGSSQSLLPCAKMKPVQQRSGSVAERSNMVLFLFFATSYQFLPCGGRGAPLVQSCFGGPYHLPTFGEPFRNFTRTQGRYAAGYIVRQAGLQDGLKGLL